MDNLMNLMNELAAAHLGDMLKAVAVLVVGWLIALIAAALVRRGLRRTSVDNRIAAWLMGTEQEEAVEVERWIGRAVFWLLMLLVLVGFFQVLGLAAITEPLNSFLVRIFEFAPRLIGPVILAVVGWSVATGLRFVVRRVLETLRLDERLGESAGMDDESRVPLARTVGEAVYWLVLLLFLAAILSALHLEGLVAPVQGMVDEVLAFLPNLFGALLILGFGWLLARVAQRIVSNLLAAFGTDRFATSSGLATALGDQRLSSLLGLVTYVLILIPVMIAALNTLQLHAVTDPASQMLERILNALPLLFGAALVLTIAFAVGRVVSGLAANLLAGVGFDGVLARLGIGDEPGEEDRTPSQIAGSLVLVAIMLFAAIEAVRLLGFHVLAELIAEFMMFAGHVLLGLIILGVGLYLANLAARTIEASSSSQAMLLALAARVSITILAGAMALRQMGLANEIITLAFGLLLGAVAVATALAFGLGCRDLARESAQDWLSRLRSS